MFFFLAMTLHPEVQMRAQNEIDQVVGDGRLPDLSDRAKLPYCNALLKEVHRYENALYTLVWCKTRYTF